MGLLDRLIIAAGWEKQRTPQLPDRSPATHYLVSDFGEADVTIRVGDMDGSGDAPGVELSLSHDVDGPHAAAIALSAQEAEVVGQLLIRAAAKIPPSERLRVVRRNLNRQKSGARS